MTNSDVPVPPGGNAASGAAAHECAAIAADLEKLKLLISDAGDRLLASFNQVGAAVALLAPSDAERVRLSAAVGAAVTALQFQDIATQLTAHALRRLDALQTLIGSTVAGAVGDPLVVHGHPVHQAEMSSGSIDLF